MKHNYYIAGYQTDTVEFIAQRIDLHVRRMFTQRELVQAIDLNTHYDIVAGSLVMDLRARLLGTKGSVCVASERVPADWFEHFKVRWFPVWALRRWPVKTREIKTVFENTYLCPHIQPNRDADCVRFLARAYPDFLEKLRWNTSSLCTCGLKKKE